MGNENTKTQPSKIYNDMKQKCPICLNILSDHDVNLRNKVCESCQWAHKGRKNQTKKCKVCRNVLCDQDAEWNEDICIHCVRRENSRIRRETYGNI